MDGVTTNGVLLMHIEGDKFHVNSKPTKWKEVSIGGNVFDLGEERLKFNYQTAVNIYEHIHFKKFPIFIFSLLLVQIIF